MGGMDDVSQGKRGDYAHAGSITRTGRMAQQAGCDISLLSSCKRCPVWRDFRMLGISNLGAFVGLVRQRVLPCLRVNKYVARRATSQLFLK